uniref:Uncharacterized protein n=1 Tax=Meloidogyne incognita TaxID=6306 RepID=A0A914NEB6_MELIC
MMIMVIMIIINKNIGLNKAFNLNFEPIDENYSNSLTKTCNSARSYNDLNNPNDRRNLHSSSSRCYIQEEADCFHQRSKSSETPITSQSRNNLVNFLLQHVPTNSTFANPSYVGMQENQKALVSSKTEKNQAPIPKPRTSLVPSLGAPRQVSSNDQPWPTSIAPMLEKESKTSIASQQQSSSLVVRPNTLRLHPPPQQTMMTTSPLNSLATTTTTTPSTSTTTTTTNTFSNLLQENNLLRQCDSGIYPEGSTDDVCGNKTSTFGLSLYIFRCISTNSSSFRFFFWTSTISSSTITSKKNSWI